MTSAIPTVKPSTTECGTRLIKFPSLNTASSNKPIPANTPKAGIAAGPNFAITGTKTTVIAPVGPLTWNLDPPKTAANKPATIAVDIPAAADIPAVIPKPIARGSATMATVVPAIMSAVNADFVCG